MDFQLATLVLSGAVAVTYIWYARCRASSIGDVPGPKNPSWMYGHLCWWKSEEVGAVEKSILEEYGTIAHWNGTLGEQRLWVADPKAIHHILLGSSHLYEKTPVIKELLAMVTDRGIATVEGDAHKRQRRAMVTAFGPAEVKALYPCFTRCSDSLADKWHENISNGVSGQTAIIDVHSWLSRATLDVIGAGAFDYDFGALENADNKLTKSYTNLAFGAFGRLSKGHFFVMDTLRYAPKGFLTWVMERDQRPGMVKLRENRACAHEVAAKLIEDKRQELKDGTSRKDLLSLLVKANSALRPEWRLSDDEIIAQVRTIMFTGHETMAKTLSCALWELAKNRHVQERLRAEVMEALERIRTRDENNFTVDDFDSMPYLLAVEKEILRVYPVVIEMLRRAKKDSTLPLSKPILGVSGKVYHELPIPARTIMNISTVGYNLSKELWGPDAYEFRPERWLDMRDKPDSPVGIYNCLLSFSGGARSCIGWRFAILEMHTFLVALVRQFDFSPPDNGQQIRAMRPAGVISPVVIGEEHKGPQMPLKVTALRNE